MANQTHSGSISTEQVGSGVAAPAQAAFLRKDTGDWMVGTTGPPQGAALDPGDGSRTIFDITAEWVFVAISGGFELAATGTPAAILADDGAGGLELKAIGTAVKAGRALPDSRGDVTNVRNDAAELHFVSVGGNIMSY